MTVFSTGASPSFPPTTSSQRERRIGSLGSTQHACSPAFIVILLNVGRVQRPTLKMLVDRDAAITGFRKEPYYHVHLSLDSA